MADPEGARRAVVWRRTDGSTIEHCRFDAAERMLLGTVVGVVDGTPLTCTYEIRCADDWSTRDVRIETIRGVERRRLELRRSDGGWHVDGRGRPEFAGYPDIDLSITPATNTLPIRRLDLGVGESGDAKAVWILFPDLTPEPLAQRYTRTSERRFAYRTADGAFEAELEVDDTGMVVRYGALWERIAEETR